MNIPDLNFQAIPSAELREPSNVYLNFFIDSHGMD